MLNSSAIGSPNPCLRIRSEPSVHKTTGPLPFWELTSVGRPTCATRTPACRNDGSVPTQSPGLSCCQAPGLIHAYLRLVPRVFTNLSAQEISCHSSQMRGLFKPKSGLLCHIVILSCISLYHTSRRPAMIISIAATSRLIPTFATTFEVISLR